MSLPGRPLDACRPVTPDASPRTPGGVPHGQDVCGLPIWRRRTWILAAGLAPIVPVRAQPAGAAAPAPPVEARQLLGPSVRLQGAGRLRMLGLSIYDARLWVGEGFDATRFERSMLALELVYARSLSGPRIADRSIDEMARGGPIEAADRARWLAFMTQAFPDVDSGDRITGTWQPQASRTAFHVNSGAAVALVDAAFGSRFFGIWLAPHSSQPAMRQQLLGQA